MGDEISNVEELPAGPPDVRRGASLVRRRELWLGLFLIGLILAFAGADWWQQEDQARTYATGQAAVSRRDWDGAQAVFAGLGAYQDAPAQAQAAATQVARRDAAYQAGRAALDQGAPFTAYRAFSTTLAITPDYRDAAARLVTATEAARRAVTDVIVRRTDGSEPGLYLRQPALRPDLWLPGSDARSRVWATDATGQRVVYDGPEGDRPAVPQTVRRLYVAAITARGVVTTVLPALPQVLPDAEIVRGGAILGRRGLWWHLPANPFRLPLTIGGYAQDDLLYFDWQTETAHGIDLPGANWAVLDIDPVGERLLIGEYRGLQNGGVPATRLYLAGSWGADLQDIALAGGAVHSARFSPDGQFVLYDAYDNPRPGQGGQRAVMRLLDLRQTPPSEQPVGAVAVAYGSEAVPLAGIFLPGDGHPRLLIKISNGVSASFSVRDLVTGQQRTLWERASTGDISCWITASGQAALVPGSAGDPAYTLYPLTPRTDPAAAAIPVRLAAPSTPPVFMIVRVEQSGGYAVYTAQDVASSAYPSNEALYSVGFDGPLRLLVRIRGVANRSAPQTLLLPNETLAYIGADQALHIQPLDAAVDLMVLSGVDGIWPFGIPTAAPWQP